MLWHPNVWTGTIGFERGTIILSFRHVLPWPVAKCSPILTLLFSLSFTGEASLNFAGRAHGHGASLSKLGLSFGEEVLCPEPLRQQEPAARV